MNSKAPPMPFTLSRDASARSTETDQSRPVQDGAGVATSKVVRLACQCGQVQLNVEKAPILSAECHCDSCRAAAARLGKLPGAAPLLEPNGGTRFELYRKDRVRFITGLDLLKEFRLTPNAKTRRVVATCCNTPVFLEFEWGHWLNLYGRLWPEGSLPSLDLRTMTSDLPDSSMLDQAVPNAKRQSVSFFAKLLGAWVAMGFKTPKMAVNGALDV